MKLLCGCIPDASGFGYCSKCTKELRKKIWRKMSKKRKDYDRHFAPKESAELDALCACSCHISAPCSYCIDESKEKFS